MRVAKIAPRAAHARPKHEPPRVQVVEVRPDHRIKPANLLLDLEGTVKILDMGLARLESAAGAEHAELTGTGQIMGTVDYMAPEQALNTKHADQRADIYSLGITLWYLLTGRAAFGGETVMEKLLAHREQPIPSLREACPGATPALETLFTKMPAKKVDDRYQSMSEVVAELQRIRSGQNVAAPVEPLVATKRPSSFVLDATIAMAGPQIDTDPKTEQSLVVPAAVQSSGGLAIGRWAIGRLGTGSAWWKHWRIPAGWRTWVLVACAAGAAALLLAGIVRSSGP